ncbi:MAG: hypothetical protein GX786_01295, partial [Clostridiales bacterium]|nr:hypothetical protein [Clostridiales bacterium]
MSIYIIAGILIALLILMLTVVLKGQKQQKELEKRWGQWEQYYQELALYHNQETGKMLLSQKEEMNEEFRFLNDNLIDTMAKLANMQNVQLDIAQKQLQHVGETQEQRLDRMQGSISKNLQRYDEQMTQMTFTVDQKLLQNEQRIEKMRQTLSEGMEKIQVENTKKLEEVRKTVDEKLHETLDKRLGESFMQVSKRLEEVYKG